MGGAILCEYGVSCVDVLRGIILFFTERYGVILVWTHREYGSILVWLERYGVALIYLYTC